MDSVSFTLTAQSTFYKLRTSKSKDYGIFIDGSSFDFIKPAIHNKDSKGRELIDMIIYKDDCIRAIGNIMCSLPLLTSKNGIPSQENNAVDVFKDLSSRVSNFFGSSDRKVLTGLYFTNLQGRAYLWGTEGKNSYFELRRFFIADHTTLTFEYEKKELVLRFTTHVVTEHLEQFIPKITTEDINDIKLSDRTEWTYIDDCLAALRTKPFVLLAGISGTGKSRIVRKLAQATVSEYLQWLYEGSCTWAPKNFSDVRWDLSRPANFELIQVKPNWHNSMDVVGYLSNIPTPHYVFTPFINFIVRALCHPHVPFFLCLDEMNLAPVEEYFAEFLSAIESRSKRNGEYTTDPIIPPFKTFKLEGNYDIGKEMLATLSRIIDHELTEKPKTEVPQGTNRENTSDSELNQSVKKHLWEKGVTLPKNLIIIGTVNMDETTFSFSRKVLDRAMSIEMNKVDYSSFLTGNTDDDIKAIADYYKVDEDSTGDVNKLNKLLVDRHIEAKEVVSNPPDEDVRFVIDYLETINKLLDETPFKLGYRAANEALIYLQSTKDFGMNDKEAAMDRFTLMKILSRIEGDESKLKLKEYDKDRLKEGGVDYDDITKEKGGASILSAMREIIAKKLGQVPQALQPPTGVDTELDDVEVPRPPKGGEVSPLESIKKLDKMMAQLDRDHFVSYWS